MLSEEGDSTRISYDNCIDVFNLVDNFTITHPTGYLHFGIHTLNFVYNLNSFCKSKGIQLVWASTVEPERNNRGSGRSFVGWYKVEEELEKKLSTNLYSEPCLRGSSKKFTLSHDSFGECPFKYYWVKQISVRLNYLFRSGIGRVYNTNHYLRIYPDGVSGD